ncbi:MAG TPA: hypothetical protein VEZ11_05610 [Thermoanaerobaculia bacterium]|nr:hypothetical protein [Thermoanaerobaculia bacterium]
MIWILLALLGMVLFSSYVRSAAARARGGIAKSDEIALNAMRGDVSRSHVLITIARQSGRSKRRDLAERYAFEEEIEQRNIGRIIRADIDSGSMTVAVDCGDLDRATVSARLQEAIAQAGLSGRATVEVLPGSEG